jgi:oligosaccharide repeat unit polymerase
MTWGGLVFDCVAYRPRRSELETARIEREVIVNFANSFRTYVLLLFAVVAGFTITSVLVDAPVLAILSGFVIAFSLLLMQKSVGLFNFRALTIPGFCYLFYFGTVLVPSFFVFAEHRGPFRFTYLFAVESALLTIPFGILITNQIFRFERRETTAFFSSPVEDSPWEPNPKTYFLFLALAWVITGLYLVEVRTVPLFYMLAHPGQYLVLTELREDALKLLNSPLRYLYVVLRNAIYPFLIVVGFGRYLQTRRPGWAVLFLASLISGLLYAALAIARGPVAVPLLMLGVYFYVHRNGRVSAKLALSLPVLVLAFPLLVNALKAQRPTDFLTNIQGIATRVFYLPADVLYYYFEVFPRVVPYQHGYTIAKFANLMGKEPFDIANYIGWYMWPHGLASVNANAPFVGGMNADFGMTGVVVGGLLAGFVVQAVQVYLVRRSKSVITVAMYAVLLVCFADISASPLNTALLSDGALFVLVLAWLMTKLDVILFGVPRTSMSGRLENSARSRLAIEQ